MRLPCAPPPATWRCHSPVTGSILITSAPRSPRRMAARGPAMAIEQSSTRMPDSGPPRPPGAVPDALAEGGSNGMDAGFIVLHGGTIYSVMQAGFEIFVDC